MTFKSYPKIHSLGKEETDGILLYPCHVQEKIDGANASVWIDKRGDITCGSRNRELQSGFNGLVDYIKNHEGINKLMRDNPTYRLYGEWLVPHTIQYNELSYRKFYLFDITIVEDGEKNEEFLPIEKVYEIAEQYGINTPHYFGLFSNLTVEAIQDMVGKTVLGVEGEGVVIKSELFIDKWGNKSYAKVVSQRFKEDNSVVFGGNNKYSEAYWETYVMNKYITLARVEKVMKKLQPQIDERLDLQHTPRIAGTVYHDMLTEEIWEIQKNVTKLDFRRLKGLCHKKAIRIYHDILNGHEIASL